MSNFEGWLLKFGNQEFPLELINQSSWKATPNQRQELDAWTDCNGVLHRETAPHTRTKIEFETVDDITLSEKMRIQEVMNSSITNTLQRKGEITYWNDETNTYETACVYIPDTQFTIKEIDKEKKEIYYEKIRIALIEY